MIRYNGITARLATVEDYRVITGRELSGAHDFICWAFEDKAGIISVAGIVYDGNQWTFCHDWRDEIGYSALTVFTLAAWCVQSIVNMEISAYAYTQNYDKFLSKLGFVYVRDVDNQKEYRLMI